MMNRMLKIMMIMTVLCGVHVAQNGGWLSGAEALAAQALVFETGQTTSYASGDDGALRPGVVWPAPRFTDNNNGTITDNLTGLIWLKNANCFGSGTWQYALNSANTLASGACGLSDGSAAGDWRLPNAKELYSLVDLQNRYPALPTGHPFTFSNDPGYDYWSSSSFPGYAPSEAWCVAIDAGFVSYSYKSSGLYVWPVRGGQSGSLGSLTIFPTSKDFGSVTTNITSTGQTFTISNTSTANLIVSSLSITGGDSGMFTLITGNGTGGSCGATPTIVPAGSCTISATFTPASVGAKSTTLRISSNDPATPDKDVALSGTGVVPTYTIGTLLDGGHGSVACDSPVVSGATSNCTISPDAGYHLATFTDNSVNKLASVVANTYSIPAVTANHAIAATFAINNYKVQLLPAGVLFTSIQDAYASAPSGSITIKAQAWSFLEDLLFNNDTAVTLTGGMDQSYNPTTGYATVKSLIVGSGSVIIGNIAII